MVFVSLLAKLQVKVGLRDHCRVGHDGAGNVDAALRSRVCEIILEREHRVATAAAAAAASSDPSFAGV